MKIEKPKEFNGDFKDLDNVIFIIEHYLDVIGVTEAHDMVRFATTLLTKNALTWWRSVH